MLIIHDKRLPLEYISGLKQAFPVSEMLPFGGIEGTVYESISCHPDIYFFEIEPGKIVHSPGIDKNVLDSIRSYDVELIPGLSAPSGKYPGTVKYNAVRIGKYVFCNSDYIDPVLSRQAKRSGLEIVNVQQGYTRCSVMKVSESAIITSDKGIADAAKDLGISVLEISPGGVELPGEEHGFIGGASGIAPEGSVITLGDTACHEEGDAISEFIKNDSCLHIQISGQKIYDAGSLLFIGT